MTGIISLIAILFGTILYFHIFPSKKFLSLLLPPGSEDSHPLLLFFLRKLTGFIFFGLIPGIVVFGFLHESPVHYGLSFGRNGDFPYLLGLPLLVPFFIYFFAKKPAFFCRYPEMRISEWTKTDVAVTVLSWGLYLLGYEFLFRGLLLFSFHASSGTGIALAVNVAAYSAAHIPKGRSETLGAVPFGFLLCMLALLTESMLLPFLIHFSLALSTEIFSIRHNPGMKFI